MLVCLSKHLKVHLNCFLFSLEVANRLKADESLYESWQLPFETEGTGRVSHTTI